MDKQVIAHGEATVRLTDKATGKIVRELTARNKLNSDYVSEIKNSLFSPTNSLTVILSDNDQPSPNNGLIFPMGHFLGYGRYNTNAIAVYQGAWSATKSKLNQQENGVTSNTFVWEFTSSQAIGALRSLYLYWDTAITRQPFLYPPDAAWKGTPRCAFENKLFDNVSKTQTEYCVGDYFTKEAAIRKKVNTLTVSGLAYDVDTGHIFVFDYSAQKIYEFASLDVDMTAENVLAEYPCTRAYFSRGLIRGNNLFFITATSDPTHTNIGSYNASTVYLHRYPFTTDAAPVLVDTMTCAESGYSSIGHYLTATFMDDYLVHGNPVNNAATCSPVLRLAGDGARMGITGIYGLATAYVLQRLSKRKQVLVSGNVSANLNNIIPMAISHLLLPEPVIKDNTHGLTVSYTISIQD